MKLEPLRFEHLQQMAEIESEAFDMPWTVNMFIPELSAPEATYLVGTREGEVLCYIAVKSGERGRGLGKMLMSALLEKAKEKGARTVTLEVRSDNFPAIGMYTQFGFEVRGIRKKYYGNKFDALIMTLEM